MCTSLSLRPHVSSEAWGLQGKQLPGWYGTKPCGFGWEQHEEGRRQIFLQHCGESLPRKWEVVWISLCQRG